MAAPAFVAVVHEFRPGAGEAWWAGLDALMKDPEAFVAMGEKQRALGYFNHAFLPSGGEGPVLCLWECRDAAAREGFQAFIDGPESPAGQASFNNRVFSAAEGAKLPASFFAAPPADPPPSGSLAPGGARESSGAFWWVLHEFKNKKAAGQWWEGMSKADPAEMGAAHAAMGYHNHVFSPSEAGGNGPMLCVWESQADVSTAAFQAFIDGEKGPGGEHLTNTCYKVVPGAIAPSAHFSRPAPARGGGSGAGLLACCFAPPAEVPEFLQKFYMGAPVADAEGFAAGWAEDAVVEFIGPHAPLGPDGKPPVLPKAAMQPTMSALVEGFSDFRFNSEGNPWTQRRDGSWACKLLVAGAHDGSFGLGFMGLDGAPVLAPTGKQCVMGPEVMSFTFNAAGEVTKKTVEPCQPGPSGPPGMYVLAGGKLPGA